MDPSGVLSKYLSRNYHLALIALGGGLWGFLHGLLTGSLYVTLATTIVGTFRAGDAVVNWLNNRGGPGDQK